MSECRMASVNTGDSGPVERPHLCHPERSEGSSNSRRIILSRILRCAQNDEGRASSTAPQSLGAAASNSLRDSPRFPGPHSVEFALAFHVGEQGDNHPPHQDERLSLKPKHRARPCRKFSQEIQLHQARQSPNFCLRSSLLGLSETPLRYSARSSPSCSPCCSDRCSPHRSDRCGLSRYPRCSPGCCPGYGSSCCPRCSLRCSTRCPTGRSDHCGLSRRPRCSPRSSDRSPHDCPANCLLSCSPSRSVHCLPGCRVSYDPNQVLQHPMQPPNPHGSI